MYTKRLQASGFKLPASGFTLIELMVVIAIIGILSAGAVAGVNIARTKARDAKRTADVAQIQKALALVSTGGTAYALSSGECITGTDALSTDLIAKDLMKVIPGDPSARAIAPSDPPSQPHCYFYTSDGSIYSIRYYLEREKKEVTMTP